MIFIAKVKRGSMFTGGSSDNFIREKDDFYVTPPKTTRALLDIFPLEGSILEPACGDGRMAEVLKDYYPNNEIISTDLIDRGYGQGGIDFLTYDYGRKFDVVITNPPFKLAKEFVQKGLEISNDKVIMLLKIQFLESKSRKEFLENSPLKYVYVFSERQYTMKNGLELNPNTGKPWCSPMMLCWMVWELGYKGEPIIRWI